ncbi:MAG: alpha/beta fold hydrolase [Myxococcaceae bacterium]
MELAHRTVATPRLRFHALECGQPGRPLVVLLHGFPEYAGSWSEVMPRLAEAGFWAVAPDLRGYAGTDRPEGGYDLDSLSDDIAALIEALGEKRAHLVGHDWGGAIAYHLAAHRPERVETLTVVNCPHPEVMKRRIWRPGQLRRSWYMFFFQLPRIPEWLLSRRDGALVPRMLRAAAVDKTRFTPERLRPYAQTFSDRQVAHAALSYYRTAFRAPLKSPFRGFGTRYPRIPAPFRLIWGEEDIALGKELTRGYEPLFSGPVELRTLPRVGHFAPIESPGPVAELIVEHLLGGLGSAAPAPRQST